MNARTALVLILLAGPAHPQGFADLGATAPGFALPDPDRTLQFPADHGAHWDFRIEWWYLTAILSGPDGADYGVQWTLFRSALAPMQAPGWQSTHLWMGHAAVTTSEAHFVAERLARGGIGQAGVALDQTDTPFAAWIDNWQMTSRAGDAQDPLSAFTLSATGPDFGYALDLRSDGPLVLHGDGGYSVKSAAGQASHYYSLPFLTATGSLTLPTGTIPVSGRAWLDREWSSQPLAADQTGWDWFSLMFDDGSRLMGFVLRDGGSGFSSGTWISADGTAFPLAPGTLTAEPIATETVAGREVPVEWRLALPDRHLDVTVTALNRQSWMATSVPYWEGPVRFSGSHTGRGYLEMTGY